MIGVICGRPSLAYLIILKPYMWCTWGIAYTQVGMPNIRSLSRLFFSKGSSFYLCASPTWSIIEPDFIQIYIYTNAKNAIIIWTLQFMCNFSFLLCWISKIPICPSFFLMNQNQYCPRFMLHLRNMVPKHSFYNYLLKRQMSSSPHGPISVVHCGIHSYLIC